MDDYARDPIHANIYITHKKNQDRIYQTIRIVPNKSNHLKYFLNEKYMVARTVVELLQEVYLGDGDNIMFEHRKTFKNATIIRYRIDNETDVDLSDQEYHVEGFKPKFDGCEGCVHLIKSKKGADRCKFYKKFLKRHKKSCQDFLEKGDNIEY